MITLPRPTPNMQPCVTLASSTNGRQTVYRPVIIDERGQRAAPIGVKRPTIRNLLSKSMSYAAAKGLPFRLEHPELAAEAAAVRAELAKDHGIVVDVQATRSELSPTWRAGYDAGRTEQSRTAPAGLTTEQEREWYDGYDTGAATTHRHGALSIVQQGGYDLALFPWESPELVIAEAEAIREEQESKPDLGWELTDEDIDILFERKSAHAEQRRPASDPMLARWEADGKPGGFMFAGKFEGYGYGNMVNEPGYVESTQPYAW